MEWHGSDTVSWPAGIWTTKTERERTMAIYRTEMTFGIGTKFNQTQQVKQTTVLELRETNSYKRPRQLLVELFVWLGRIRINNIMFNRDDFYLLVFATDLLPSLKDSQRANCVFIFALNIELVTELGDDNYSIFSAEFNVFGAQPDDDKQR